MKLFGNYDPNELVQTFQGFFDFKSSGSVRHLRMFRIHLEISEESVKIYEISTKNLGNEETLICTIPAK